MIFAIGFFALFFHGGYHQKIVNIFSKQQSIEFHAAYNDKAVDAWSNCLAQFHTDADIVFFGDSLTRRGSFDTFFPDKTICNLGLGSDTITGMTERVGMIETVSPEKVFVMGGINSIRDNTLEQSASEYDAMLNQIHSYNFHEVFIISVLPIAKDSSDSIGCSPNTITSFNSSIEKLAAKYGFLYIDLHSLFASQDGYIKQVFTTDGVHLTDEAYQIWVEAISHWV